MSEKEDVFVPVPEEQEDYIEPQAETWGVGAVWNAALLLREERKRVPRDYIYASELGKPLVDIWYNLRAEPVTNPPNPRSMRKFAAGDIWEWIVMLILIKCGILVGTQERVEHQYPGLIKVSGRLDFIAGGKPDFEKGREQLENLMLLPVLKNAGQNMITYFEKNYPNGLEEKVVEVKSAGAFMFANYVKSKRGGKNHRMQNTHYIVGKNMRAGELFYISRDDCRIAEFPVLNPGRDVDEYKAEIERITEAMKSDVPPPIEKLITFDEEKGKFSKVWGVEYSQYLTKLYGFKRPDEYVDAVKPAVARFNRVMGRVKENKTMTKLNLEALAEMKTWGFDPTSLVDKFSPEVEDEEANGTAPF